MRNRRLPNSNPVVKFWIAGLIAAMLTVPAHVPAQATTTFDLGTRVLSVDQKALTSNVATLRTTAAHNFVIGEKVTVSGVDSTFNGTYEITAVPTTTTFTYAKNAGDVGQTAVSPTGIAIVSPTLSFNRAVEVRGGTAGSERLQNLTGNDGGLDIGVNLATGDYVDYYNVVNVSGQQIDARVTFLSEVGSKGNNNVDGLLDELDDETGTTAENTRISVETLWNVQTERYVELKIEFYINLANPNTRTKVTLQKLILSIYDIDNEQFVEISGFNRYYLSSANTILSANSSSGILRLTSEAKDTSSNTNSDFNFVDSDVTVGRASFDFDSTDEITLRLGQIANSQSNAVYDLDFGAGESWTTRSRGSSNNNPVASNKAVSFLANGGTGSMTTQYANSATSLTANSFTRSGFTFSGWNTAANGSGASYADSASFPFTSNTTLYAQWTAVPSSSNATVTFDANGGSGTMETQTASAATSLRANAFARPGHVFNGWNTQANGSGTAYADGASFPFSANTTLYAQWILPAPYSGPIPIQIIEKTIPEQTESLVTLAGERLNQITAATVLGKTVQVTPVDASNIRLLFPALPVGVYDVTYTYRGGGILTHQRGLTVVPGKVVKDPEVFTVSKRFTNYRGDRGPVVARDQRAIAAFIKENPGLTSINCEGSTSGVPAIRTDAALATARAQNACRIVARLVPGIKTTISISTGQGIGQYYRAVTLSGEGVRQN